MEFRSDTAVIGNDGRGRGRMKNAGTHAAEEPSWNISDIGHEPRAV